MTRTTKVIVGTITVLLLIGITAWVSQGPVIMARVAHATYTEPTYQYGIEIDTFVDMETGQEQDGGLIVTIEPQFSDENTAQFSDAYMEVSQKRLQEWLTAENRQDVQMDILLVFAHPLSEEEVNALLHLAKAEIFESAVVGYVAGIPFTGYAKETGHVVSQSLDEVRDSQQEALTAVRRLEGYDPEKGIEVGGYAAVRLWVDGHGMAVLAQHAAVQFVDTTPQAVREKLALDRHWQNAPISVIALPMPVGGYDW